MKRANGEPLRLGSFHHCSDPFSHFVGCFIGEGDCEDGIRTDSLMKQIRDPHRDYPSLPGAGAGQNENRSLGGGHRFKLLRVEIEEARHWKSWPQLTATRPPSNADAYQLFRWLVT
jgi:hypothetical protein